jgi:hypothetical protein
VLGPVLDEVVFVGGATIHIWITDPGAPPTRATDDVDVVCEVATRTEYDEAVALCGTRAEPMDIAEAKARLDAVLDELAAAGFSVWGCRSREFGA